VTDRLFVALMEIKIRLVIIVVKEYLIYAIMQDGLYVQYMNDGKGKKIKDVGDKLKIIGWVGWTLAFFISRMVVLA